MSLPQLRPAWTYSEQQTTILREMFRPWCQDGEGVHPAPDPQIADALGPDPRVVVRELDAVAHGFGYAELVLEERRLRTALTALRRGLIDSSD